MFSLGNLLASCEIGTIMTHNLYIVASSLHLINCLCVTIFSQNSERSISSPLRQHDRLTIGNENVTIVDARVDDTGVYTCLASSISGTADKAFKLFVMGAFFHFMVELNQVFIFHNTWHLENRGVILLMA